MKNLKILITTTLLLALALPEARGETRVDVNRGGWLSVNGTPMVVLGGELGNSSATSPEDIRATIGKLYGNGLNTVLVPAYWELIEPKKGKFDFSLVDSVIDVAAAGDMKVVFLWFGAWKNSMSCYAPEWVKRDTKKYPRARTESGKPLEILSAFSEEVQKADLAAFKELLRHIKDYEKQATVVMIQVENEIGMLEDARDHSAEAEKEYQKGVPSDLMKFLKNNEATLHPKLKEKWNANGRKMAGSWREVFGDDIFTDEYFMAWNYARYVEKLAAEGKKILKVPFYLNAALNSRNRVPGEYPSAGPLAHLKDIWHAGAPSIEFLAPDIYDSGFESWVAQYALPDNILFIPEVRRDINNGAQAYYVTGHHDAIGISPFSIENGDSEYFNRLRGAYTTIDQLTPVMTRKGLPLKEGVLLSADNPTVELKDGSTRITLSHFFTLPWDPRAADKANWNDAGAILLKLDEDEYILAGSGVVAKFEDENESGQNSNIGEDGFVASGTGAKSAKARQGRTSRVGLLTVEEVKVNPDGSLTRLRTLNGDESHQGRHARIGVDDHKILHIKTYRYD